MIFVLMHHFSALWSALWSWLVAAHAGNGCGAIHSGHWTC